MPLNFGDGLDTHRRFFASGRRICRHGPAAKQNAAVCITADGGVLNDCKQA
jgi:hypothetical protein